MHGDPHAISQASIPALISRSVSPERQGAVLGINASLMALASVLGPMLMGMSSGTFGIQAPFVLAAILMLFSWSTKFLFYKDPENSRLPLSRH
jgi:MFS family permease